jgi:hypothetical protein
MAKTYKIPCCWQMYGHTIVEAESLDEAIARAEVSNLPSDCSYVEGSFEIDHDGMSEDYDGE